jgi:hypothetical protein
MRADTRKKMGDAHERYIADLFGVTTHRGSGNQAHNPLDGKQRGYGNDAWEWDCKSTQADSMSIGLKTWWKLIEQGNGGRPMIPIRFYRTERLDVEEDLVVIRAVDLLEVSARD